MKITFPYDPIKVEIVKGAPDGRKYNKKDRSWTVDDTVDNYAYLLSYADILGLDEKYLKTALTGMSMPLINNKSFEIDLPGVKLLKHQQSGINLMLENNSIGIFDQQGCGKTLIVIACIKYRIDNNQINKALIVSPKNVMYAWDTQIKDFSNLNTVVIKGTKQKRVQILKEKKDIFLINYDLLKVMENELIKAGFDMIVFDESHFLKNYTSLRSKSGYKISQKSKYKALLTGTPISKSAADIFSQYKILDETIFGKSFHAFRNKYFYNANEYYPDWKLKENSIQEIKEKMQLRSRRVLRKDVLDLPNKIYQKVYFEMNPLQKKIYKDMKDKMVAFINNETVMVNVLISKLMKLSQICSGFYINDDEILDINNDKVKHLAEIVKSNPDEKIVIWTVFKHDIVKIKKEFPDALVIAGNIKQEDRNDAIYQFQNNPDKKMIIINTQSGSTGITLTASNLVVFYSRNYSMLDREQAEDRNFRYGTTKNVLYIDLLSKNTIEETIIKNVEEKRKFAGVLLNDKEDMKKTLEDIVKELKE